jgi:DNA-binding NarL/FixJ family response regulator
MLHAAQRGEAAITPQLAARMMEEFRRLARLTAGAAASVDDEALNPLTTREREVLLLIAQGSSDREIAQQLTVSLYTVKSHVRSLLQKLQVASRHEAARMARQDRKN